jgi:hypothetical protein
MKAVAKNVRSEHLSPARGLEQQSRFALTDEGLQFLRQCGAQVNFPSAVLCF